eukprot:scaffold2708_cov100-Isochrysis_galbana.AAC.2
MREKKAPTDTQDESEGNKRDRTRREMGTMAKARTRADIRWGREKIEGGEAGSASARARGARVLAP